MIFEYLGYLGMRLIMLPFQMATLGWARFLGASLGLFAYYVFPLRKSTVRKNLTVFFGDKWDEKRMRRGVREAYRGFGIAIAEFAYSQRINKQNVEHYIKLEQIENYRLAHASGRPVIFYGAHQAMWEWSQYILHYFGADPFFVIMKRIHNRYLNAYLEKRRHSFGAQMLSQRGAVAALDAQKETKNANFGFFVDQRAAANKGVWIDVCGHPFSAMPGPAILAVREGGLPILPIKTMRTADGLSFRCEAPIEYALSGNKEKDVQHVTQLIQDRVTSWILEAPESYFWFHNRFKGKPAELAPAAA